MDSDMMTHADIDALIATLHPHVLIHQVNDGLAPSACLRPREDTADVRNLAQAFATLFSYHPGCDAAAVAVQTAQSKDTPLYICLSPSIPHRFEGNVKEWLAQFTALREESKSTGGARTGDTFSPAEKSFILHTYKVCYPSMRHRVISQGFGDWGVFVKKRAITDEDDLKLTKNEHADNLQRFSELVRRFAECISRDSLGEDEDVLRFHKLCMAIRDMISNRGFLTFLNRHMYCKGAQPARTYFSPPLALSTLLALSRNPNLTLGDQWSSCFLGPSGGVRQFSAVVTKAVLAERFGKVPGINWEHVVQAFENFAARPNRYGASTGYEWNADKKSLSTARPVAVHPEITLIQHLVESGEGRTETYIACSRAPCYASVLYAGAVNETLKMRFTMDLDKPEWCQLYKAEPWILPEVTQPDVVAKMKGHLLQDLEMRVNGWLRQSGHGPDLDWEDF